LCGAPYRPLGGLFGMLVIGFQTLALTHYLAEILGAAGRLRQRAALMVCTLLLNLLLTPLALQCLGWTALAWILPVSGAVGAALMAWSVARLVGAGRP
jgi:O-antigen/teichoic acid export membrane protein